MVNIGDRNHPFPAGMMNMNSRMNHTCMREGLVCSKSVFWKRCCIYCNLLDTLFVVTIWIWSMTFDTNRSPPSGLSLGNQLFHWWCSQWLIPVVWHHARPGLMLVNKSTKALAIMDTITFFCKYNFFPEVNMTHEEIAICDHDRVRFLLWAAIKSYTVETLYSTIYYSKYFIELNFDKSTQYVALWTH